MNIRLFFVFVLSSFFLNAQVCNTVKALDVFGNEDVSLDCSYPVSKKYAYVSMHVEYPKYYETDQYKMQNIDYQPAIPYNSGQKVSGVKDDIFAQKIDLPFTFCFFGNAFRSVIVGDNGVITFNDDELGRKNSPKILGSNPNPDLHPNAIFAAMQDLVFSDPDSGIYYKVLGDAPCRRLVISYYKGKISGCDQVSNFQVILYEGSNQIEVHIEDKPIPCSTSKFRETLIGIINSDGTKGYSPSGRNTGEWSTNKEAWRFVPSGAEVVPDVKWFNSANELVGNGAQVEIQTLKSETFKTVVTYPTCNANSLELTDDFKVNVDPFFPVPTDYQMVLCGGSLQKTIVFDDYRSQLTSQPVGNFKFSFYKTLDDAEAQQNALPATVNISGDAVFYVRIESSKDSACYAAAQLSFRNSVANLLTDKVLLCDNNNDGVESNYRLSDLNDLLFGSSVPLDSIHYFLDANTINGQEVYTADLREGMQFWVMVVANGCSQVFGPIKVHFNSAPNVAREMEYVTTMCDVNDDDNEKFDWIKKVAPLISKDPNLKINFYASYEDAAYERSTINYIRETPKSGDYYVYARVEGINGCYTIVKIRVISTFDKVKVKEKDVYICYNGDQTIDVNLKQLSDGMLIDPFGLDPTFHLSFVAAEYNPDPAVLDPTSYQIVAKGYEFVKTIYVRYSLSDDCYTIRKLNIHFIHPELRSNKVDICDFNNDGVEVIQLGDYIIPLVLGKYSKLTYYRDQAALDNGNNITSLSVTQSANILVKIENGDCVEVYPVDFTLVPTPVVPTEFVKNYKDICDNNADGAEYFDLTALQSDLAGRQKNLSFEYYETYNETLHSFGQRIYNPTQVLIYSTKTYYVKVISTTGGCFSVSKVTINAQYLPVIKLNSGSLSLCDADFNIREPYNLSDALPQIFKQDENQIPLSDLKITYYTDEDDANKGGTQGLITNSATYEFNTFDKDVFVRFSNAKTGCYSVALLRLKTYQPPKAINTFIQVCDNNLDGVFEVNLLDHKDKMIAVVNPENVFTFYQSQSDALAEVNPIANPSDYQIQDISKPIFFRVRNIPGCYDIGTIIFNKGTKLILQSDSEVIKACDQGNDGVEAVNLRSVQSQLYSGAAVFTFYNSLADLNLGQNEIANPEAYLFVEARAHPLYVKVEALGFCNALATVNVELKKTPIINLNPVYYYCPDNGNVDIQPDYLAYDIIKYEWINAQGQVVSNDKNLASHFPAGVYNLRILEKNGCDFIIAFQIQPKEVPVIDKLIVDGHTVSVVAKGSRRIMYSTDGVVYGYNSVFHDLPKGVNSFYVKFDDDDCIGKVKRTIVLDIPNAITPNGDGVNDAWSIDDLYVFEGMSVSLQIFDRFSKPIFQQNSAAQVKWDGMIDKRPAPTGTYWYIVKLPDGRELTGYILLKNY